MGRYKALLPMPTGASAPFASLKLNCGAQTDVFGGCAGKDFVGAGFHGELVFVGIPVGEAASGHFEADGLGLAAGDGDALKGGELFAGSGQGGFGVDGTDVDLHDFVAIE